jgi:formylglycine-generating enzyme required for sulfatase activity/serine/threonine protein kinase
MPTPSPSGATPDSLFAGWLDRREAGEPVDIEALCRAHPDQAESLRELHAGWREMQALRPPDAPDRSLSARLRQRFGTEIDPRVQLEREDGPEDGPPSQAVEQLADRSTPSTRYVRGAEIAHGGMGRVLQVWDADLRRQLAMKVLRGPSGSAGEPLREHERLALARFLEEAQVTGQLEHPGIVPVHELGLDEEGRVYFTMKLVRGRTLQRVLDELARGEGGWTQTRVLGLLLKVCEAMSYAHAKGVIHRDLKPANVMVGRFGEVYVMDWGLARIRGRAQDDPALDGSDRTPPISTARHDPWVEQAGEALLTHVGDVIGTPAYMPPEQAAGDLAAVGAHSDVYAVGAMLYHLLAGRAPYQHEPGEGPRQALWRRVRERPPPSLHDVAPQAPVELVAICERAMSRAPRERYPHMSALADDLTAYVEGRVVRAYETGPWAEARKWVRRNRPLAVALAAAAALTLAGLGAVGMVEARGRAVAEAERTKVLRLSDDKRLDDLLAEERDLWPIRPDKAGDMQAWMDRARALLGHLPRHRETLAAMRAESTQANGDGADTERLWQLEVLGGLVEGLEALREGLMAEDAITPEHGWSVPRRLAFARELEQGFAPGGALARVWEQALPAIRDRYPGLELGPQLGLLPLGPDPDSQLWEFAHLMSGAPPRRDGEGRLELTAQSGIVLVLIPSGGTRMGAQSGDPSAPGYDPHADDDEAPPHEVTLPAFFLSKYELTRGQWRRITGRDPSFYSERLWETGWLASGDGASGLNPVEQVSWRDLRAGLQRAGLDLPREAQWEYAARGGTATPWWTGADERSLVGAANIKDRYGRFHGGGEWAEHEEWLDDGATFVAPVGSYAPNPFGLHDVIGNVWELCLDGLDAGFYARSPRHDPLRAWEDLPRSVCRGGSYLNLAAYARVTSRNSRARANASPNVGARPVRSVAP